MGKRIQSLQSLRGLGFLLIFCSHCTFISFFSALWGAIGVSIFVILSGFVVTLGADLTDMQSNLKTAPYILKRIYKIFPLHIIMLCLRLVFDYSLEINTPAYVIFLNITMLKSFIPVQSIYYSLGGVSWYLTLILLFALLTPFLLRVLKSINKRGCCIYVFIIILFFRILWIYHWHTSDISQWWNYINPLFRITDYFLGMILGTYIPKIRRAIESRKTIFISLRCMIWFAFISYAILLLKVNMPWYNIYLRTPLSLGLIILFVNSDKSNKAELIGIYENKFLIYIGNISFELFLIHIHVRNFVMYIFEKKAINNNIILLISIFIITVILSQIYFSIDTWIRQKFKDYRNYKRGI